MPWYEFINDNGETIERQFSMADAPWSIEVEGVKYTRNLVAETATQAFRVKTGNGVGGRPCSTWPRTSTAMGVAESQVKETMEHDRRNGVPTDYTAGGDPILTSPNHEKAYMKLHGFAHRGKTKTRT